MKLTATNISKRYFRDMDEANYFEAVAASNIAMVEGTLTVMRGRSGSGKTTLLSMLAGLLAPTEGIVAADDLDIYCLDDVSLSKFRNENIGVVPQGQTGIGSLTVIENVMLPAGIFDPVKKDEHLQEKAAGLLDRFDILHLANVSSTELSGGELRRMAVARALINDPSIILADEPTGDLDDQTTALVLRTLRERADEGDSVLIVTHESEVLEYADTSLIMDPNEHRIISL